MSNKVIEVNIKVRVMSIDSVPALLQELVGIIERESDCGMLEKTDGDRIEWATK